MLMEIDIRYPDFEEEYWNAEAKKVNELEKERDILKAENIRLKRRDFITENKNLHTKYNALEQKYWEAQRTIDKYAAENEELKKWNVEVSNKMNLYKYQSDRYKNIYVPKEEFDDLREKYISLGNAYMDLPSKFQYEYVKKDLTRWREMYYDLQKERDELENQLLDTEDKLEEKERELKETQKYLVGYQKLYYDEVVKNKKSDDRDEDKALDIYDLEDGNGEDADNKS